MASVTKTRISKFRLSLYKLRRGKLLPICLPTWEGKQAGDKILGRCGNAKWIQQLEFLELGNKCGSNEMEELETLGQAFFKEEQGMK